MPRRLILQLLFALLALDISSGRTFNQHGVKTWSAVNEVGPSGLENLPTKLAALNIKPQTETIEVGGTNLLKQAEDAGMDMVAVTELLRTKQPVITSNTDAQGHTTTTTYKLTADGSISSQTVTEPKTATTVISQQVFDQPSAPLASSSANTKVDETKDWEWATVPKTNTQTYTFSGTRPFDFGHTLGTPKINWPNFDGVFERRDKPVTFTPPMWSQTDTSSNNWYHKPNLSGFEGVTPRTEVKTEVDDQGRTITTTKTIYSTGPVTNWSFNYPSIFDEPKTEHRSPPKSKPNFFDFDTKLNAAKPSTMVTTTPLPSLDDFLKTQYGPSTKNTILSDPFTPTTSVKPTTTINVDDFPVSKVPKEDNKPVLDATWLHELNTPTSHTTPDAGRVTTNSETSVKTISKTVHTTGIPTSNDLDPNMLDVLHKAGINPEDIQNLNGDSITKTRVEPDGRVIKTTYRVSSIPHTITTSKTYSIGGDDSNENQKFHDVHKFIWPTSVYSDSSNKKNIETTRPTQNNYSHKTEHTLFPTFPNNIANPVDSKQSEIDKFLAKINLSPTEILSQNGEVVKTLVDDNGRILSATFVLSTVKGNQTEQDVKDPVK